MARDVNHVMLVGEVCSTPTVTTLKNGKRICLFSLKLVEKFTLASGQAASHDNVVLVEVLGPKADRCLSDIFRGHRYHVTGYLRVDDIDGMERTRIRAFNVQAD